MKRTAPLPSAADDIDDEALAPPCNQTLHLTIPPPIRATWQWVEEDDQKRLIQQRLDHIHNAVGGQMPNAVTPLILLYDGYGRYRHLASLPDTKEKIDRGAYVLPHALRSCHALVDVYRSLFSDHALRDVTSYPLSHQRFTHATTVAGVFRHDSRRVSHGIACSWDAERDLSHWIGEHFLKGDIEAGMIHLRVDDRKSDPPLATIREFSAAMFSALTRIWRIHVAERVFPGMAIGQRVSRATPEWWYAATRSLAVALYRPQLKTMDGDIGMSEFTLLDYPLTSPEICDYRVNPTLYSVVLHKWHNPMWTFAAAGYVAAFLNVVPQHKIFLRTTDLDVVNFDVLLHEFYEVVTHGRQNDIIQSSSTPLFDSLPVAVLL